ncbi:hypothetical protein GCM10017673_44830 [Streptosporangium violaceochromogenes]|nr:hypothetical protein GCM10017673_44830 [Streptosporangium violaceochromogenes]
MAARFLSMLVGVFTDRFRVTTSDTTASVSHGVEWPPYPSVAAVNYPVLSQRFTATPDQVKPARKFVAEILGDSHPSRDDAVLLTSELATNAIEHSTESAINPREFLVTVAFLLHSVLITVQDPGFLEIPCPRDPAPDATGGRGLALVNSLATRWGFHRDSIGTVIWFELNLAN